MPTTGAAVANYTAEIDVEAPAETVFAFLEDFTNAQDWDPGVASAERLDDGEIELGSRFALDLRVVGSTQRWIYEVERHEPPHRVTFATRTSRATGVDEVTIVPRGEDACLLIWDATFGFNSTLGKRLDPTFGLVFNRIAGKAVDGLRAAVAGIAFEA